VQQQRAVASLVVKYKQVI